MNPLVKHALDNVWSVPEQSSQTTLGVTRISPLGGYVSTVKVGWNSIQVPKPNSRFHIFQIGYLKLDALHLPGEENVWYDAQSAGNIDQVEITAYNTKGVILPRYSVYYRRLLDGNLIIAIEILPKVKFDYEKDHLYLRFFRNPFYARTDIGANKPFKVSHKQIANTADILTIQNEVIALRGQSGITQKVSCFINGLQVDNITVATAKVGDIVEYVYDGSIYRVLEFPISTLNSFTSTLDQRRKFLLSNPMSWSGFIDHCFGADVYVRSNALGVGRYFNRNKADALRMVTFADYSLCADYLAEYYQLLANPNTGQYVLSDLTVRLVIRQDGNPQVPVGTKGRTEYLQKLAYADRINAMVFNPIEQWDAATLENSTYTLLMQSKLTDITEEMVLDAYGYSAAAMVIAPACQKIRVDAQGTYYLDITPLTSNVRHARYVYDTNGKLLRNGNSNPFYPLTEVALASDARYVENIPGFRTAEIAMDITDYKAIVEGHPYQAYKKIDGKWRVLDESQYVHEPGLLRYPRQAGDTSEVLFFSEGFHLYRSYDINPTDGVIFTNLSKAKQVQIGTDSNGQPIYNYVDVPIEIPMGDYDLWLNGNLLVDQIDYRRIGTGFVICNKAYLKPIGQLQRVEIRAHGMPGVDEQGNLIWRRQAEYGFVFNGKLSRDSQYDLHRSSNTRLSVGGSIRYLVADDLIEEDGTGLMPNGKPYELKEPVLSLDGIVSGSQLAQQEQRKSDVSISQYLTARLPQQELPINVYPQKHKLYSPFLGKIIHALKFGNIPLGQIQDSYTDEVIRRLVAPYLWLYEYDPANPNNTPNLAYVEIEPHFNTTAQQLSIEQYRFFSSVVRLYAGARVNIANLVTVA